MGNQMHGYCEIRGFMSTYHDILWIFSAYKLVMRVIATFVTEK